MAEIPQNFGEGGAGLVPNGSRVPSLNAILRDMATDLQGVPTSRTGIAVAANTATLSTPGLVQDVQATTAGTAGPKTKIVTGAPAAGQVAVSYDAAGIPTLTFAAADAVTECAVNQLTPLTTAA